LHSSSTTTTTIIIIIIIIIIKGGRCIRLTTLPPSFANCLEIWEPQPPGTLSACPGL
jgi:hypothetical protein